MKITILGSGGFEPQGTGGQVRNPAGYALTLPGGETLVLDIGFGNVRRMAQCAIALPSITHVFLTHFHPDHWGDLPALLFNFRYAKKPEGKKLLVAGPAGTIKLVEDIHSTFRGNTAPQGYELAVAELTPGEIFRTASFSLNTTLTGHTPEALAFRLESGGKTLAYTGDAAKPEALADFFAGADLLVGDAGMPSIATPPRPHMTPPQVLELGRACGVRKIVFSHL